MNFSCSLVNQLLVRHPLLDVEELVHDVEVQDAGRAVPQVVGADREVPVDVPDAHVTSACWR